MHLVPSDSQNFSGLSESTFSENDRCLLSMLNGFHTTFMEENYTCMEEHSTFMKKAFPKSYQGKHFCVFRTVQIINGHNWSGQLKRVRNSDSKTHVNKQNPTSITEIRRKSLKYLFLETPCTCVSLLCILIYVLFIFKYRTSVPYRLLCCIHSLNGH